MQYDKLATDVDGFGIKASDAPLVPEDPVKISSLTTLKARPETGDTRLKSSDKNQQSSPSLTLPLGKPIEFLKGIVTD